MKTLTVTWQGPFAWPGYEQMNGLPSLPPYSGVYLQAFDYDGGFAIWGPGITSKHFIVRFKQHTRAFLNGENNVLDPDAVQQRGERKVVWHGTGYSRKRPSEFQQRRRSEFEQRRSEITVAVHRLLGAMRIFTAEVGPEKRVASRMEFEVEELLYKQAEPLSRLPDQGTFRSRRWPDEEVILVESRCDQTLHGIPPTFEI
jgi:hypothetical protein